MRILKLRFQNLNSLQGEWEIDFRHAAYADEGIFAITGSTGAGKSTILDAICLPYTERRHAWARLPKAEMTSCHAIPANVEAK